jgi:hypothetical protein
LERLLARAGVSERAEDMGNTRKESAIEIEHAKKTLKRGEIGWLREGKDRLHFG